MGRSFLVEFYKGVFRDPNFCTISGWSIAFDMRERCSLVTKGGHSYSVRWNDKYTITGSREEAIEGGRVVASNDGGRRYFQGKSLFFFLASLDEALGKDKVEDMFREDLPSFRFTDWAVDRLDRVVRKTNGTYSTFRKLDHTRVFEYGLDGQSHVWEKDSDLYFLGVCFRLWPNDDLYSKVASLHSEWFDSIWVHPSCRATTNSEPKEDTSVPVPETKTPVPSSAPLTPKTRAEIALEKKLAQDAERMMSAVENSEGYESEFKVRIDIAPKLIMILQTNGFRASRDVRDPRDPQDGECTLKVSCV